MERSGLVMLVLAAVVAVAVTSPTQCIKDQQACVRSSECCGGCCQDEKCVPFSENCNTQQNPCTLHQCPDNKECYLHQVQCVTAPCPPVPACRDSDYSDYE